MTMIKKNSKKVIVFVLAVMLIAAISAITHSSAYASDYSTNAVPINVGSQVDGTIESGSEVIDVSNDYNSYLTTKMGIMYSVTLEKSKFYDINMISDDMDSYLCMFDSGGGLVGYSDDYEFSSNSNIKYSPVDTGTFYIFATTFEGNECGDFTLSVNIIDSFNIISGLVTNEDGMPLSGIEVALLSEMNDFEYTDYMRAYTDSQGRYTLYAEDNSYKIRVSDTNNFYLTKYYLNSENLYDADLIEVEGSDVENETIILDSGGSITGTVTDTDGLSLGGITVILHRFLDHEEDSGWDTDNDEVVTDAQGRYNFTGLSTGDYRVEYYDSNGVYETEYWNNKFSFTEADKITVTQGEETDKIDASLNVGASISGTVTDENDVGLNGICVTVYQDAGGEEGLSYVRNSYTEPDGTYKVGGLSSGVYVVGFIDENSNYKVQYWDHAESEDAATDVTLSSEQNLTGIDATLSLASSVSGVVTNPSGEAIEDIRVTAYQYDSAGDYLDKTSADTDENGEYTIMGLSEGEYKIRFDDSNNFKRLYVEQWWNGKATEEEADSFEIGDAEDKTGVDAVLTYGGSITGTVKDKNGIPIKDIYVYSYIDDGYAEEFYAGAYTDENGRYTITGLDTADYGVRFHDSNSGYIEQYWNGVEKIEDATPVSVVTGQETPDINATLTLGGKVTGTVTNNEGDPLRAINVTAYFVNEDSSGYEYYSNDNTDRYGKYEFKGLPEGNYVLEFNDYRGNYVRKFWQNGDNFEDADVIEISPEETKTGFNMVLKAGSKISGTITDSQNNPVEGAFIHLLQHNGDYWEYVNTGYSGYNGSYTIGGVNVGTYKLFVEHESYAPKYWQNAMTLEDADNIIVDGENLVELDFALDVGSSISGKVSASDESSIEGAFVHILRVNEDSYDYVRTAETDSNGEYQVNGLNPGTYIVEFVDYSSNYVSKYWDGKSTMESADRLVVGDDDVIENISMVMPDGGRIHGTVKNEDGQALSNIDVNVFTKDSDGMSTFVKWTSTDNDGKYALSGLEEDDYYIMFTDSNEEYLEQYWENTTSYDDAKEVKVTIGLETEAADATMKKAHSISGKITDSQGDAIEDISVAAYKYVDGDWEECSWAFTDSNGTYKLKGLVEGTYRVGYVDYNNTYLHEFWNNSSTIDNADTITLEQNVDNINASLSKGGEISGAVLDRNQQPVQGARVRVYEKKNNENIYIDFEDTNEYGEYKIKGLPSGQYIIEVSHNNYHTQYWEEKNTLSKAIPIDVRDENEITNIDFALFPSSYEFRGSLSGKVNGLYGELVGGIEITAFVRKGSAWEESQTVYSNSRGEYSFASIVSGDYKLSFYDDGYEYRTRYWGGDNTIESGEVITIDADETLTNYNVIMTYNKLATVKFDANQGTAVTDIKLVPGDKLTTIPDTTREGYNFLGWFNENDRISNNTVIIRDLSVVAKWEKIPDKKYTITFNSDGGNAIAPIEVVAGQAIGTLPISAKSGWKFEGWVLPDGSTASPNTIITGDTTLTAKWSAQSNVDTPKPSPTNTLSKINVKGGKLTAKFSKGKTTYTLTTKKKTVTITPAKADKKSKIQIKVGKKGKFKTKKSAKVSLKKGKKQIVYIKVIAQNKSTKTYKITVKRQK